MLVNARQPEIMFNLVHYRSRDFQSDDSFSEGVASAVIMALDTTPGDEVILSFQEFQPDPSDRGAAGLWRELIAEPISAATRQYLHDVQRAHAVGEVFRYQPLPELARRLTPTAPSM
jgi:hypothetical protein